MRGELSPIVRHIYIYTVHLIVSLMTCNMDKSYLLEMNVAQQEFQLLFLCPKCKQAEQLPHMACEGCGMHTPASTRKYVQLHDRDLLTHIAGSSSVPQQVVSQSASNLQTVSTYITVPHITKSARAGRQRVRRSY